MIVIVNYILNLDVIKKVIFRIYEMYKEKYNWG